MRVLQVLYWRPRQAIDVIPGMGGVLDPDDVAKICKCITDQPNTGRWPRHTWPVVMDRMATHAQYITWQPDPSMWCYGGRAQRVSVGDLSNV